jgi:hypothetical protein
MHKSFILVYAPRQILEQPPQPKGWFAEFSKHPAVLVILGFALSGLLGGWLTHRLDQQQREREARIRSMDDLRASIDDLNAVSADYFFRSIRLVNLRESGALEGELSSAQADYQAAYYKWVQRLSVDRPNINQRYPSSLYDSSVGTITLNLQQSAWFVNDCIERATLRKHTQPDGASAQKIVCTDRFSKAVVTAEERLLAMDRCVRGFTFPMRPNPNDDFSSTRFSDIAFKETEQAVLVQCDFRRLTGELDFNGIPR